MALIDSNGLILKAGSDARDVQWFTVTAETIQEKTTLVLTNEGNRLVAVLARQGNGAEFETLENMGLAFDHAEIILCAINRLRTKPEYTDSVSGAGIKN